MKLSELQNQIAQVVPQETDPDITVYVHVLGKGCEIRIPAHGRSVFYDPATNTLSIRGEELL